MTRERLSVEWQHIQGAQGTCQRCTNTGRELAELKDVLGERVHPGLEVALTETILPREALSISNRVLVNGTPIEELLDARVEETPCEGCGELEACCGEGPEPADCRALVVAGERYETLGLELLLRAVEAAADSGA